MVRIVLLACFLNLQRQTIVRQWIRPLSHGTGDIALHAGLSDFSKHSLVNHANQFVGDTDAAANLPVTDAWFFEKRFDPAMLPVIHAGIVLLCRANHVLVALLAEKGISRP